MRIPFLSVSLLVIALYCTAQSHGNKYHQRVVAYADAMIQHGRDHYGTEHSPLFASALDRFTYRLDHRASFSAIPGIRESDRSLRGANPLHDVHLFEILYELSAETQDPKYKTEADRALRFFFRRCQSPTTGLMTWGEHIFWDFLTDTIGFEVQEYHEAAYWPFWDEVYRLDADAAWQFALSEWRHQVADSTGDFSRHARWTIHAPETGADFPRYAGQMIERWADALHRPQNARRKERPELLRAIQIMTDRMAENRRRTPSGHLPAFRGAPYGWIDSNLELARCLHVAAQKLDRESNKDLTAQLQALSADLDRSILSAPHRMQADSGYALTLDVATGMPITRSMNKPYTTAWEVSYGNITHAGFANACFERYRQLAEKEPQTADRYRNLALEAANYYLQAIPDTNQILQPAAFAEAIQLMLHAHTQNGDQNFLRRAEYFATLGLQIFMRNDSPLPKATNRHQHYESLTGGAAFMAALWRLSNI